MDDFPASHFGRRHHEWRGQCSVTAKQDISCPDRLRYRYITERWGLGISRNYLTGTSQGRGCTYIFWPDNFRNTDHPPCQVCFPFPAFIFLSFLYFLTSIFSGIELKGQCWPFWSYSYLVLLHLLKLMVTTIMNKSLLLVRTRVCGTIHCLEMVVHRSVTTW